MRRPVAVAELGSWVDDRLREADEALAAGYPGDRPGRQPIHTVYVPADRYDAAWVPACGATALAAIDQHRDQFEELVGDPSLVARVQAKLSEEPVEDLRIDFEDGYVGRTDADEDADVVRAARDLARSQQEGQAAPYGGIRMKSLERATRHRALATLVTFVSTLRDAGGRTDDWVVTLPKVTSADQVEAMVHVAEALDVRFEIQVETPQSILGPDGTALVARMVQAGGDRLTSLHYGTYDYSAFCGIVADQQSMEHPVADHAKLVMQAAAAGTGVRLSDGSTNILPVGDEDDVRAGWHLHHRLVTRSLERGYYQGWDLHPAQLPTRYAATYAFYRRGLSRSLERLADYTRDTMSGIADEPATARALASYLLRGVDCGAVEVAEVESVATIGTLHELASTTGGTS